MQGEGNRISYGDYYEITLSPEAAAVVADRLAEVMERLLGQVSQQQAA